MFVILCMSQKLRIFNIKQVCQGIKKKKVFVLYHMFKKLDVCILFLMFPFFHVPFLYRSITVGFVWKAVIYCGLHQRLQPKQSQINQSDLSSSHASLSLLMDSL